MTVGLAVAIFFGAAAAESRATGLREDYRPWFYLIFAPIELFILVYATSGVVGEALGRERLPGLILRLEDRMSLTRPNEDRRSGGIGVGVLEGIWLSFVGAWLAFLSVPIQVLLTTWLIVHPEFYSPVELVIVGVETILAVAWLGVLVRAVVRGPRDSAQSPAA